MIEVGTTAEGVRAVDTTKTSIEVTIDDWEPLDETGTLPRPTDATVTGRATTLRFPPVFAVAERLDGDERFDFGSEVGPLTLPGGDYLVRVDGHLLTYVGFSGPATLRKPGHEQLIVDFPAATTVTLGFRSRAQSPSETITVPATVEGVATALSYMPAGYRTATPDRTFPTMRGHPPLVEFGEETRIPDIVSERREPADVRFVLPPELRYLYTASSLSNYLGAELCLEADATPRLETDDLTYELPSLPAFQNECAALLRRTFWLDCVVRNGGPHGTDLDGESPLETLDLDAESLYSRPIASRLEAYLDAPFDAVEETFPRWHLSMYVDPTFETAETLPYLLRDVPNVYLPQSQPLSSNERLTRSLDDFYRGEAGDAVSVDLLNPQLGPGRIHGWLSDGAPIDVFRAVPEAYRNRYDYRERADEPIRVVAVLNDTEMADEHVEAADIYRQRATELDLDITVREHLETDELAGVFERKTDLVHYIGHCETTGLRCPDGTLAMSSLRESNAQTFFLNACGSFQEGIELVRQGSVAGAVTFNEVLDSQAARVGTMFARLLMNGFSIERALRLARRRIIMGKDYTVVGDGTHVLTQSSGNYIPSKARLTRLSTGEFELWYDVFSPSKVGSYFQPYFPNESGSYLCGTEARCVFEPEDLWPFLETAETPILFDGDLYWSDELVEEIRDF